MDSADTLCAVACQLWCVQKAIEVSQGTQKVPASDAPEVCNGLLECYKGTGSAPLGVPKEGNSSQLLEQSLADLSVWVGTQQVDIRAN